MMMMIGVLSSSHFAIHSVYGDHPKSTSKGIWRQVSHDNLPNPHIHYNTGKDPCFYIVLVSDTGISLHLITDIAAICDRIFSVWINKKHHLFRLHGGISVNSITTIHHSIWIKMITLCQLPKKYDRIVKDLMMLRLWSCSQTKKIHQKRLENKLYYITPHQFTYFCYWASTYNTVHVHQLQTPR